MTIPSSLPSNVRKPGAFHEFEFSARGSAQPLERRFVIIAEKTAAGTAAADTPVQLFGESDGDAKCGVGSLAALMNRKAILQARLSGFGEPEIWVVPLAEPGAGTAATYTLTLSGSATQAKDLILKLAGRLIVVGVNNGDAAATIATAIKDKCDELGPSLPFTAGAAGDVVTLTFRTKGVNGNDVARKTLQLPTGVGLVHAVGVAGAGATSITTALGALYDKRYHGLALANHVTSDAAAILADLLLAWGFGQKNYRFLELGERGSLGTAQTLQASFNDYRVGITACENTGSLPGEIATAVGVSWWAREAPNANLDGELLALDPPDPQDAFTDAEIESALASGVTPLVPAGTYCKLVRKVTSQITVAAAPFEPLREPALPRTVAYMAEQEDIGFTQGFHQETMWADPSGGDDIFARVRDMVIDKHRAAERSRYLRNVDDHLPEIKAEEHPSVAGRILIQDPMTVAGPLHQGAFLHIGYLG
jgi:phage tail sheath gpL-like